MNKMIVLCSTICMLLLAACDSNKLYDSRDGKTYRTVTIGTQTWMAENLNYSDSIAAPGLIGRTICYNNSLDSCAKYGRLYNWAAAMDSAGTFSTDAKGCGYYPNAKKFYENCKPSRQVRGICPKGWHLPSKAEWEILYATLGTRYAMQAKGFKDWSDATDAFGFSALPAGYAIRYSSKDVFCCVGGIARFWSTDWIGYKDASVWQLEDDAYSTKFEEMQIYEAVSVRCVKDGE